MGSFFDRQADLAVEQLADGLKQGALLDFTKGPTIHLPQGTLHGVPINTDGARDVAKRSSRVLPNEAHGPSGDSGAAICHCERTRLEAAG
jgi:hypothetical protein